MGGECRIDGPVSTFLKDGYAYRPGLFSLIQVGQEARGKLNKSGADTGPLTRALEEARAVVKKTVEEKSYASAIRNLRHAIRAFDGDVEEAGLMDLNFLVLGKW